MAVTATDCFAFAVVVGRLAWVLTRPTARVHRRGRPEERRPRFGAHYQP